PPKERIMKKIIFFLLISLHFAQAQSVQELTHIALEQNLDLKILEKEYRAALERAPQVSQLPNPEVGVGGFPMPVQTRLGPQIMRLSATQMLPWMGTLERKENLELAKAKVLYERIAARALMVKYELEQAYFQLYEWRARQAIIQRALEVLESLERVVLAKVESGKATVAEVLRVQLQMEEAQQELKILEQLERKPMSVINQLLNRALNVPIEVADTLEFAIIKLDRSAWANTISTQHPMLKMYKLQQEVAQSTLKVNELANKPSFKIGVDYLFVNDRTDINFLDNGRDALQVRASVSIPIYRKAYEAKVREEQLKIETFEDQKTNTLNRFLATIEQAFVDYESAKLRLNLYQKQKEITQSAINILEANYSAANSDFGELLRLERELIEYDLKELEVIVESHLIKSTIERFLAYDGNAD
ncbi:MAG: TolC family protein, partial [Bacteroidota bacterium]